MGIYGADLFPEGAPAFCFRVRNANSDWLIYGKPEDGTDEVLLSLEELAGAREHDFDDITGAILFRLRDGRTFWVDSCELDYHAVADRALDRMVVVD